MNSDDRHDAKIDALYSIAREIKEARQEIVHCLRNINAHLGDISSALSEINRGLPNVLDHE